MNNHHFYIPEFNILDHLEYYKMYTGELQEFNSKTKPILLESSNQEEYNQLFIEKVWPLFEKYHIPSDFDAVIDQIVFDIKQAIDKERSLNNPYDNSTFNNLQTVSYINNQLFPIEYTGYVYDVEDHKCYRKNFKSFTEIDNKRQFPVILYFYQACGENNIAISEEGKSKTKIVKFNLYLGTILGYTENQIVELVRHEVLHIVERLQDKTREHKFFRKYKSITNNFDSLRRQYSDNDITIAVRIAMLFSNTEMNARVNELKAHISNLTHKEIQEICKDDKVLQYSSILELMKSSIDITLIDQMDDIIFQMKDKVDSVQFPEWLKCLVEINYLSHFWKTDSRTIYERTFEDHINFLGNELDKIKKEFEVKCMKIIYYVLKEEKGYIKESILSGIKVEHIKDNILFGNDMQIFYLAYLDNRFKSETI